MKDKEQRKISAKKKSPSSPCSCRYTFGRRTYTQTITAARHSKFWTGFAEAIKKEIRDLETNNTWTYVDRHNVPHTHKILRSKIVFDIKRGAAGDFIKFKARMVAMGNTQTEGVDFFETYASVLNTKSFRIFLAIYNQFKNTSMQHWDIKQAFVQAPIEEEIYVHQIKDFEIPGQETKILRLKKALYGTKQAANAWQKFLTEIFIAAGGVRNLKDECAYMFREGGGFLLIGTHVDDIFPLCNPEGEKIRTRVLLALKSKVCFCFQ